MRTLNSLQTLDLLYANVGDEYKSTALPLLGGSDYNLVHVSPIDSPFGKRIPVTTRTVKCWNQEAEESLQDCFELTDWDVFCDNVRMTSKNPQTTSLITLVSVLMSTCLVKVSYSSPCTSHGSLTA